MNTACRELDFYRIRDRVGECALTEEGQIELLEREPFIDPIEIEYHKNLSRQWFTYLCTTRPQAFSPWPVVADLFGMLSVKGNALVQDQLFALGLFCMSQAKAKQSLSSAAEELEVKDLAQLAQEMPSLLQPEEEIFAVLDRSGQVRDLPSLREIRSRIASLQREIENTMRRFTSDAALQNVLQSNVPAFKQDRELLAVKSSCRNQIKGIIHQVSASGSTVYIEPEEIVKANNDLVQEQFRLESELRRIFAELTEKLALYKDDFEASFKTMVLFDTTLAAAKYAQKTNGVFAQGCNETSCPQIIGGRHPLLGEKAVPIDISFLPGKKVLIVTGPNTGGKTVTLKTFALFSLMNQAGFPVPAKEETRLPVFTKVFADIGDEQSIDESLSTFSAHMRRIGQMLENADADSLVLIDEMGSGTDPQEGAAIAMATLDHLVERNCFILVTTHQGILKNYGYTHPNCINASVEFDSQSLKPTYRLIMGVPGESHAVDIAEKSGIPARIIEKARGYISGNQADVSVLITGLNAKHAELNDLLENAKEDRRRVEELNQKLMEKELRLKERELELNAEYHKQNNEFLKDTRSKLENLVRVLREGEINREKTLGVKSFITELTQEIQKQESALEQEKLSLEKQKEIVSENGIRIAKESGHSGGGKKKKAARLSNKEALKNARVYVPEEKETDKNQIREPEVTPETMFMPGTEVLAGRERRKGVLLNLEKNNMWLVQFGAIKMKVPQSQLIPVNLPKPSVSLGTSYVPDGGEKPVFELRLLGMRYEEAMKALEKQLDLCAIHSFREFSVIHGKGNGILQSGVQNYLKNYPGVKDFHFAPPEEGGSGKTYVVLF